MSQFDLIGFKRACELKVGDAILNSTQTDVTEIESVSPLGINGVIVSTADGAITIFNENRKVRVYRI